MDNQVRKKIPIVSDVDVLVYGRGVVGVAAAICAARNGSEVLLIERYGFLGGPTTGGLVITTPPLNNGIYSAHIRLVDNTGRHEPATGEINFSNLLRFIIEAGYVG